jgi:hypothetical protein
MVWGLYCGSNCDGTHAGASWTLMEINSGESDDDDVFFYLFLQKQKSAQNYIPQGYFPPD